MAVRIKNIFFFFLPYILSPLINIEGGGGGICGHNCAVINVIHMFMSVCPTSKDLHPFEEIMCSVL